MGIRKEEFLLLKALVISNCDVKVEEQQALWAFREAMMNALFDCVAVIRYEKRTAYWSLTAFV